MPYKTDRRKKQGSGQKVTINFTEITFIDIIDLLSYTKTHTHTHTTQHTQDNSNSNKTKMAGQVRFLGMTKLTAFIDENPASVDDWDARGETALCAAAWEHDAQLVAWLVDEKGASVHRTTALGQAPLHCSNSLETLSFLLARGVDVTALYFNGWTPLMLLANDKKPSCVERLLQEPTVLETIDTQATGADEEDSISSIQ